MILGGLAALFAGISEIKDSSQAKKEEALAQLRELQLARERKELIPRPAVVDTWTRIVMVVRGRLLALPNRIAAEAAQQDAATVAGIVKREVYAALRELADTSGLPQDTPAES